MLEWLFYNGAACPNSLRHSIRSSMRQEGIWIIEFCGSVDKEVVTAAVQKEYGTLSWFEHMYGWQPYYVFELDAVRSGWRARRRSSIIS